MSTAIETEVTAIVEAAPAYMTIETLDHANIVSGYLKNIRSVRAKIAEFFRPTRESAHATWKGIIAQQDQLDAKPAEIEAVCRRMLGAWQNKEEERIAAEQRRLDDEARQAAVASALAGGDSRQAKAIESGKVAVVSSRVVASPSKVAGVSARQTWQADVVDLKALIREVANNRSSIEFLQPNMTALNAVARSTKGNITIKGVMFRQVTSIAAR